MSITLMSKVWDLKLTSSEQAVLMCMADHAWDDGTHCFPSIARIAYKTGYSERHVQRVIRGLQKQGVLTLVKDASGGRGKPREYTICLEKGDMKSPFTPKGDRVSPIVAERVTSAPERVTSGAERVTPVSPEPSEEPLDNHTPPVVPPRGDAKPRDFTNPKSKRGSRLPPGWTLPNAWRQDALTIGLEPHEIEVEAEKFRDHWHAAAGSKGVKLDWHATWCNWARRAVSERKRSPRLLNGASDRGGTVPDHPVLRSLAAMIDSPTVRAWFGKAEVVSADGETLTFRFPGAFARAQVCDQWGDVVYRAAARHGFRKVRYEVQGVAP